MEQTNMDSFICASCKKEVHVQANNYQTYAARGFYCNDCYAIFANKLYEVNIPGAVTIFSPASALGDRVIYTAIHDAYMVDNPDENVLWLEMPQAMDVAEIARQTNAKKIFWADVTNFAPIPKNLDIVQFSIIREARNLGKLRGIFPKVENRADLDFEVPKKSVMLHARHCAKLDWKNMHHGEFISILNLLKGFTVYIVGNDEKYGFEDEIKDPQIVDLRKKLTIDQICTLAENVDACLGVDSGIQHLAGAANGKVIAYKYKNEHWMPIVADPQMAQAFGDKAVDFYNFLVATKKTLHLL